jgi:hypothetical protein
MLRFAVVASALTLASALEDVSEDFYAESELAGRGVDNATMQGILLKDAAEQKGAVCLDGSPGMVYVRKGVGDGANKWYIHHQGGGWCESLDDCLGRSKGGLGSSKGYKPTSAQNGGYFSTSPVDNPMMYNWNSVFMPYCDGGSFSGNNDTVQPYQGATLHWRGKRIREAVYEELIANHGLKSATDVVISGCSAGGLATFLHTDQWCDALAGDAKGVKCVGMPDSGFFLDYQADDVPETPPSPPEVSDSFTSRRVLNTIPGNYHAGLKWCFETFNATAGVNPACIAAHHTGGPATDDPDWLCMFAEHSAAFTHTPIFPLQSQVRCCGCRLPSLRHWLGHLIPEPIVRLAPVHCSTMRGRLDTCFTMATIRPS